MSTKPEPTISQLRQTVYGDPNIANIQYGYRGYTLAQIQDIVTNKKHTADNYYHDVFGVLDWIDAKYDIQKLYLQDGWGRYYPAPLWRDTHFTTAFLRTRATLAAKEAKETKQLHNSKA